MRLTVAVKAVVLGSLLHGIALPAPLRAAGRGRGERIVRTACVRFTQETDQATRSMTFELHNACEVPVDITLRWTLACGRGAQLAEDHAARLDPGRDRVFVASAQGCTESSWRVHSIKWGWTPLPGTPPSE